MSRNSLEIPFSSAADGGGLAVVRESVTLAPGEAFTIPVAAAPLLSVYREKSGDNIIDGRVIDTPNTTREQNLNDGAFAGGTFFYNNSAPGLAGMYFNLDLAGVVVDSVDLIDADASYSIYSATSVEVSHAVDGVNFSQISTHSIAYSSAGAVQRLQFPSVTGGVLQIRALAALHSSWWVIGEATLNEVASGLILDPSVVSVVDSISGYDVTNITSAELNLVLVYA